MEDSAAQYRAGLRDWLHSVDAADRRYFTPQSAGASAKEKGEGQADAVAAKDKGNEFFKRKDFRQAVEWYTRSLQLDPMSAITVANRAMAHLQLKDYAAAEADSEHAIALDATYVKAYMRRGTARKALGKLDLALEDFDTVMRLEKENKQAAQEAASLRQALAASKKGEAEKAKKDAEERSKRQAASVELEKKRKEAENVEQQRKAQELKQGRQIEEERTKREENEARRAQSEARQPTATTAATEKLTPAQPPPQASSSGADAKSSSLSSSAILALSSGAAQLPPASVTLAKPASVFDFEKAWSNIKDDTAAFYDYFQLLEPKNYAAFFGNSMTPAIISSIIAALTQHGLADGERFARSLEVLRHLPSIRRWRIILKKEDKSGLKVLFDRMLDLAGEDRSGGVDADAVQEAEVVSVIWTPIGRREKNAGTTEASREFDDLGKALVRGELVYPGDAAYPAAIRTWNSQVKKRPQVVVRARGAGDVVAAVKYAALKKLPLAVKAGGHSMTCLSDGLVIDLSLMRGVRVDVENKLARVEAGCLLSDVDAELSAFGLVVPAGVVSHTGVAGLTLGGGVGHLGRLFGLTCDHLVSVDIVTADGQLRFASKTQNEDLFWAVRGAGANFGVVTSFEFRCQSLSAPVFAGPSIFPLPQLAEVGKAFIDVTSSESFPKEAWLNFVVTHGPSGHPCVLVGTVVNGSAETGAEVIKPFTDLKPIMQMTSLVPFVTVQKGTDALVPHGRHYYQSGIFVNQVNDEMIAIMGKHCQGVPSPKCVVMIETEGGMITELPDDECAVAWRQAKYCINILAAWENDAEEDECKAWVRALAAELKPYKADATYINMFNVSQEEKDKIPISEYFGTHSDRVREIKRKWDPTNLFCAQTNILKPVA